MEEAADEELAAPQPVLGKDKGSWSELSAEERKAAGTLGFDAQRDGVSHLTSLLHARTSRGGCLPHPVCHRASSGGPKSDCTAAVEHLPLSAQVTTAATMMRKKKEDERYEECLIRYKQPNMRILPNRYRIFLHLQ